MKKRIFITGGHLTPALAVIDELKNIGDWQIYFIGRKFPLEGEKTISVEYQVINQQKIPFLTLTTGRLQRRLTIYTITSLFKIPLGLIQSSYYLLKYRPAVILSFGGYLALPIAIMGYLLGVPIVTHEQTVTGGLSNKIIARLAKKICLSYVSNQKYFPKEKTVLTGNPLRKEIWQIRQAEWQKNIGRPLLYITGGSLGAHFLNQTIGEILEPLLTDFFVIHQTGESLAYHDRQRLEAQNQKLPVNLSNRYFIRPYISNEEIGWVLNNTDLIVGRAGANTVSEIIALFKPAIFIPLPYVSEQKENASLAESLLSARVLPQEGLSAEKLLGEIKSFWQEIKNRKGQSEMINKTDQLIKREAASLIVKEIYAVVNQK